MHTVTVYRGHNGDRTDYPFNLVSTTRAFAKDCAQEAKALGSDVSLYVLLADGSEYVWTQGGGWLDVNDLPGHADAYADLADIVTAGADNDCDNGTCSCWYTE